MGAILPDRVLDRGSTLLPCAWPASGRASIASRWRCRPSTPCKTASSVFHRSGLFYGDLSTDRIAIPITCYLVRTADAIVLFDTGLSPRAVPGLLRTDPLARFTDADLLIHRLDAIGLAP